MNLFTTIVVMLMVFDQTPITTEARHLRKKDGQDRFKGNAIIEGLQDDFNPTEGRRLRETNGFAPTSPGNSPGIGHKKAKANVEGLKADFKPTEGRKFQKTNPRKYSKAGSTDAFTPTSPGNSPGIGHKKGNANVEGRKLQKTNAQNYFKAGTTEDFAPTTPGNSPGVGHTKGNVNVKGLKDDFEPKEETRLPKTDGQKHFKAGYTDDFAPTSPGNSPGIGHKKEDGFKPTTPGHSPGIGHAVMNNDPKA